METQHVFKPEIVEWELKINENGVEMAIIPANLLRQLLKYVEQQDAVTKEEEENEYIEEIWDHLFTGWHSASLKEEKEYIKSNFIITKRQ